jgi:hypothetical protein
MKSASIAIISRYEAKHGSSSSTATENVPGVSCARLGLFSPTNPEISAIFRHVGISKRVAVLTVSFSHG